jgi:hypothetical protein
MATTVAYLRHGDIYISIGSFISLRTLLATGRKSQSKQN